jgi:hypothetical protein
MTIPDIDLSGHSLLASYDTYADAQYAVDALSDREFPMAGVTIVGADPRLVEVVTRRLTTPGAALAGAGTGAWFGLLIGVVISLGTPYLLGPLLWGLFWGAVFGAAFGAIGHAAWRGRRDFASTRQLVAGRYDVLVPRELLLRAQQTLNLPPASAPPPGPGL